jgi:hypothetical protein
MDTHYRPRVVLVPREYTGHDKLDAVAKAFRKLRLQALESDPSSFGSSDFVERQEPLSFWTKRLQNPQAKTFALIHSNSEQATFDDKDQIFCNLWQGMLVLLGPKFVDPRTYDNES